MCGRIASIAPASGRAGKRRSLSSITPPSLFVIGLALLAPACMAPRAPSAARTDTVAAIRAARELGAVSHPRAAYHLELAEAQLERAEALMQRGQMDRAEGLLVRAEADAELAIALTREAVMEAEAERMRARIREMRERL